MADGEGVDEGTAESHARAVFGVPSETVGDEEFWKARSQLPEEYDWLFESGGGDRDA